MTTTKELTIKSNGIPIKYKYKEGILDCRHLIVIFSGFGWSSNFTYDFGKSVEDVPSYILWIKDEFYGNCCLYSMYNGKFDVEFAVVSFIRKFITEHHLDPSFVTIVGASKGGAAALYLGTKYKFKNIIASAPQIRLGDFLSKVHNDVFNHMTGSDNEKQSFLNEIIPNTIQQTNISTKNYVVVCSDVDEYETCVSLDNMLHSANSYVRISCTSKCVRQHNQITRYELPYIKGILLLNSQGKHPYFTSSLIKNGSEPPSSISSKILEQFRKQKKLLSTITLLKLKGTVLFIEGNACIKGHDSSSFGLWKKELVFRNIETKEARFVLIGSAIDKQLCMNYYDRVFCDYSTGAFATLGRNGIDLSKLDPGEYSVEVKVSNKLVSATATLTSKKAIEESNDYAKISASESACRLEIYRR